MGISLPVVGVPGLLGGSVALPPQTVESLSHWYRPVLSSLYQDSSKTTPVASDGDPVGAWVCAVVGTTVTQATTAAKPTYRIAPTGFNGQPALQFDSGDYLQCAFSSALTQPTTIFVVPRLDASAVGQFRMAVDGNDTTNRNAIFGNAGPTWGMYAGTAQTGGTPDSNTHILTCEFNGASSHLYDNGVAAISADPGANVLDGLTVGFRWDAGAGGWLGHIADIIIYTAALSAADKNTVQNYLADLYSVSVTEFS